jgi:hypothetical protein
MSAPRALEHEDATFTLSYDDEARPESQDFLIKMVHRQPTLRWLRSDLTDENASPCSRLSDPKCDICTLMKLLSCTFTLVFIPFVDLIYVCNK